MSPKEILFKREYAVELLGIARGDLDTAQVLNAAKGGRPENIGFHAQQVVEKCLKAVLCAKGVAVPLVHDAATLMAKLPKGLAPPLGYLLTELDLFATIKRYEEGRAALTQGETQAAISAATRVYEWAKGQISG